MREALRQAKLYCVDRELDPKLEITRYIGEFIARRGHYPTFLFQRPKGFSELPVLMNWLTRPALLQSLGVGEHDFDRVLASRLREPGCAPRNAAPLYTEELPGLDALPILQHQPRDLGRYLTSFIAVLDDPAHDNCNTGFYRVYVKSSREAVIFMDPRTHASEIVQQAHAQGRDAPITLFVGGALAHFLAAASTVPRELDSFEASCRLGRAELPLARDPSYPPAPADAEIVIHARVLARRETEAPFGEFKGYYCPPTQSPVLAIDHVYRRPDAMYPGLFCGKESGLTLMSLSNEILMYQRLVDRGFAIRKVRYPLDAFGEFLTIIESDQPSQELLDCALELDRRCKLLLVTECADRPLLDLSTFDFDVRVAPYVKRNEPHGSRVGAIIRRSAMDHVEY